MGIRFKTNEQKSIEALIWVIQRGGGSINLYNAMKILFEADKYHLNKYTRPVTGDRYIAMEYGTVPNWIYGATKLAGNSLGFSRNVNMLENTPGRVPDRYLFSESDEEALEHGFNEYASLDFNQVRDKNHEERAWIRARNREPYSEAPDILFEDMIDDPALVDDLLEMGQYVVI